MFDYLTRLEWKRQRRSARFRASLDLILALAFFAAAVAAASGATLIATAFGLGGLLLLYAGATERGTAKRYTRLLEKP